MTIPPLAIVQARMGSTRLKNKMLLDLGGHPLIWWAWKAAVDAFGSENVVVAMPYGAENDELAEVVMGFGGWVFKWDGEESDVLGRFIHCAHTFRWHPDTVIVRITPDDPFKDPDALLRVAHGDRLPVELGGEAFTLAMLGAASASVQQAKAREHITHALFRIPPPAAPPGRTWSIDTLEDLERAREEMK